jgi:parvulin-like peptidyl-prolyl isomerase
MISKISFLNLILLFFICFSFCSGCLKKTKEPVVAWINKYDLRVSEYKETAKQLSAYEKGLINKTQEGKKAFLNQLIDREVLLLEAQKMQLHKDKDFMKQIELFWGESLINELIKRKSKELISKSEVEIKEIDDFYENMKKRVYARIVVFKNRESAEAVLNGSAGFEISSNVAVVDDTNLQWFGFDEINLEYRDILFKMKPGEKKPFFKRERGWIVFYVEKFENVEIPPKEQMYERLRSIIGQEKQFRIIDSWINELREKAEIKINEDVLEYIEV